VLLDRWQKQIHEGTLRSRPSAREKQLERELDLYKKKVGELSVQVDLLKKLNGYVVTGKASARSANSYCAITGWW